jgi:2-polyprenyl-3-methyl-5-hydroxy-6-metoxy-1,4-benzoquinol methylase
MNFKNLLPQSVLRAFEAIVPPKINPAVLNQKFFGYDIARALTAALPPPDMTSKPRFVGLGSKPSTQEDLESDWAAHWATQLKTQILFHRKIWEYVYLMQALFDGGAMEPGKRGLGFGCGREAIASSLAGQGLRLTITDLPSEEMRKRGWADTNQHAAMRDAAFYAHLVDYPTFDSLVEFRPVNMNAIPNDLRDYDFCWSVCAFEHLGSIDKGLDFVVNAMDTLKPGGVAVHTTEFNYLDDTNTLTAGETVLFQRRHFEQLAERLTAAGHKIAPLDFYVGSKPMDRFIDIPPYPNDYPDEVRRQWGDESYHLKLMVGAFACTCFGLMVIKGPGK